eukprot:6196802-Pleurochrysis_carterae.AAC.2
MKCSRFSFFGCGWTSSVPRRRLCTAYLVACSISSFFMPILPKTGQVCFFSCAAYGCRKRMKYGFGGAAEATNLVRVRLQASLAWRNVRRATHGMARAELVVAGADVAAE